MIVYEIKNKINGKSYIGQHASDDLSNYWGSGKLIKAAINKYGIDNFDRIILERCVSKEELNEREKYWIAKNNTIENGYNLTEGGTGGDTSQFIDYSDEWTKKQRQNAKDYWNNLSDGEKKNRSQKMLGDKNPMFGKEGFWKGKKIPKDIIQKSIDKRRSYKGDQNPNWKGGITYAYCECGKKITQSSVYCNECVPKSGSNNPFFGKQHSEDTKNRLSEKRMGKKPSNMKQVMIDNIIYESISEATRQLGICGATILWRINSKNKKFQNYQSHPSIKAPLSN
jgi:group I intron endonuclease